MEDEKSNKLFKTWLRTEAVTNHGQRPGVAMVFFILCIQIPQCLALGIENKMMAMTKSKNANKLSNGYFSALQDMMSKIWSTSSKTLKHHT